MDYGTITLAFIALLLLYILYTFFFVSSSLISNPVDLNVKTGGSELEYAAEKLKNPGSTRYYYEAYIYIDSNAPGTNNVIFHRGDKFYLVLDGSKLKIYDSSANVGTAANGVSVFTPNVANPTVATVTETFPFQRWTQVVVNVDGNAVDIYLEGQLVISTTADFGTAAKLKNASIQAGNSRTMGKMKDFVYRPVVISPQEVYNSYMRHNSMSGLGGFFSKYGIDMSIAKNNENLFDLKLL